MLGVHRVLGVQGVLGAHRVLGVRGCNERRPCSQTETRNALRCRHYYRKMGFELDGPLMSKKLTPCWGQAA